LSSAAAIAATPERLRDGAAISVCGRRPETSGLAPWQEKRVAAFIDANLAGGVALDDLARVVRLSSSHFARAFKRSFGQTPHQFVIERRIARARDLMVGGDAPLCQIALQCGFADQAHLSRMFGKMIGTPPGAWRGSTTKLPV
jgi:AraC-like DNA-binding protein